MLMGKQFAGQENDIAPNSVVACYTLPSTMEKLWDLESPVIKESPECIEKGEGLKQFYRT